jgi:hypothetical protein
MLKFAPACIGGYSMNASFAHTRLSYSLPDVAPANIYRGCAVEEDIDAFPTFLTSIGRPRINSTREKHPYICRFPARSVE